MYQNSLWHAWTQWGQNCRQDQGHFPLSVKEKNKNCSLSGSLSLKLLDESFFLAPITCNGTYYRWDDMPSLAFAQMFVLIDQSFPRDPSSTTLAYVRIVATRGQQKAWGSSNPSRRHTRAAGNNEGSVLTRNNQQACSKEILKGICEGIQKLKPKFRYKWEHIRLHDP